MSYPCFPSIFYSEDDLPTCTFLIKDDHDNNKEKPKINWNTIVIDLEEENPTKNVTENTLLPYTDNDEGLLDCMDIEDNFEIFPTVSGKYKTSFHVPSCLIPVIVGPKGVILRQLQDETQTLIKVPRRDDPENMVKITGPTERAVASARNQVSIRVLTKREKLPSTHFVSIPIVDEGIKSNFEKFKKEVLSGPATRGLDGSIFQNPDKLHMTIEVLTLLDELEIETARQILAEHGKSITSFYLTDKVHEFILKGIEIMNDDPSEVDVLYAKVQLMDENETENFQEVVDELSKLFQKSGFVRKQYDHVKLHVTLMNSSFRKDGGSKRTTFDATYLMEQYQNFDFGRAVFRNIDLSIRFTTGKNGYYDSVISVPVS